MSQVGILRYARAWDVNRKYTAARFADVRIYAAQQEVGSKDRLWSAPG